MESTRERPVLAPDATFVRSKRSYPPPSASWFGEVGSDEAEWRQVAAERKTRSANAPVSAPERPLVRREERRHKEPAVAAPARSSGSVAGHLWVVLGVSGMLLAGAMLMSLVLSAGALLVLLWAL